MRLKTIATTLFVALMLVIGTDYLSFAATGQSFILGHTNTASSQTTLTRTTNGPVLALNANAGQIPIKVNRTTKNPNLNADLLDGLHAAALQTSAGRYTLPALSGTSGFTISPTGLAPGRYLASYSVIAQMSTAGSKINCYYSSTAQQPYRGLGYGSTYSTFSTTSATTIIDTRTTPIKLTCFVDSGTATVNPGGSASEMSFVKLDQVGSGTSAAARYAPSARVPSGGAAR